MRIDLANSQQNEWDRKDKPKEQIDRPEGKKILCESVVKFVVNHENFDACGK